MKGNGRWSLDPGGVVKEEGVGHSDWSPLLQKDFKIPLTPPPAGPHPCPALQLVGLPEGGTHPSLVPLKGWERPRSPSLPLSLETAGAAGIPREHPPILSHGLCECGDPAPMRRAGVGADSPGRVGADENLNLVPGVWLRTSAFSLLCLSGRVCKMGVGAMAPKGPLWLKNYLSSSRL